MDLKGLIVCIIFSAETAALIYNCGINTGLRGATQFLVSVILAWCLSSPVPSRPCTTVRQPTSEESKKACYPSFYFTLSGNKASRKLFCSLVYYYW